MHHEDMKHPHAAGGWPGPPLAACGGREIVKTSTPGNSRVFVFTVSRPPPARPSRAQRPAAGDSLRPSCAFTPSWWS